MNKRELISRIRRYMGPGTTHSTASAALEAVLASIATLTESGERLQITRFGAFQRIAQPPRMAHHPRTGRRMQTPARSRLTFAPARGFPEQNVS